MNVENLIFELSKYNPNAEVKTADGNDICLSYSSVDGANKSNTKLVFIEEDNLCESCFFHDGGGYCNEYGKRIEDVNECYQYLEE